MGQKLLQPNRAQYSLEMLLLYPRYTRASYLATTGQQAPPFVVTEPIKRWALPPSEMAGKNALELFTYRYVDASTGRLSAHSIPYDVAGRLNIPGVVD